MDWWYAVRLRLRGVPGAIGPPLPADVWARVEAEFVPEQRAAVEAQLRRYSARDGRSELDRVQLAILELAKGNALDVVRYTDAAVNDYRDVIYWAYYYDDDPYWPLTGLIDELVENRKITADDAFRIRNEPGVTAYHNILVGLLAELTGRRIPVTAEQRSVLHKLCGLLSVPKKQLENLIVEPGGVGATYT